MQAQIRLGRIFGIEIGLHYSWLIIAVLIATSLAGHFSEAYPDWAATIIWTTAIMTALLFLAAIIVHELSHAAIARLRGLPVRSITLFALGGVAQIGKEAADAKTEFWMGIVGAAHERTDRGSLPGDSVDVGLDLRRRARNPGYGNAGVARIHQLRTGGLQYGAGFPNGWRSRTPRGHLVDHRQCGQGHSRGCSNRTGHRIRFHRSRYSLLLWRSRLQWPVDCIPISCYPFYFVGAATHGFIMNDIPVFASLL
jgi:hypothetical protein